MRSDPWLLRSRLYKVRFPPCFNLASTTPDPTLHLAPSSCLSASLLTLSLLKWHCHGTLHNMSQSTSQSSAPSAPVNRGDLLVSGLFSDFTIICQGERIPVHRSILYGESSFFRSALTMNMKVSLVSDQKIKQNLDGTLPRTSRNS